MLKENSIQIRAKQLGKFQQTFMGLMFSNNIKPVYFKTRFGVHTFFVKFPIDVVILDKDLFVRKMKTGIKPWRIYIWNPLYFNVLELPAGTIRNKKLAIGKRIKLI